MNRISPGLDVSGMGTTYFPVTVSYKSVIAKLVGVTLSHFAKVKMNSVFSACDDTAATNSSQSPVQISQQSLVDVDVLDGRSSSMLTFRVGMPSV